MAQDELLYCSIRRLTVRIIGQGVHYTTEAAQMKGQELITHKRCRVVSEIDSDMRRGVHVTNTAISSHLSVSLSLVIYHI